MEIFPRNTHERAFNVSFLFIGLVIFAYFISQLTSARQTRPNPLPVAEIPSEVKTRIK